MHPMASDRTDLARQAITSRLGDDERIIHDEPDAADREYHIFSVRSPTRELGVALGTRVSATLGEARFSAPTYEPPALVGSGFVTHYRVHVGNVRAL